MKKAEKTQPAYCLVFKTKELIVGLKGYLIKLKSNVIFDFLDVVHKIKKYKKTEVALHFVCPKLDSPPLLMSAMISVKSNKSRLQLTVLLPRFLTRQFK